MFILKIGEFFMILLMSMDPLSKQAAEQLSQVTGEDIGYFYDAKLSDIRSSSITLVDLRADSKFQDCHNAESFADFFYKNKISPTVEEIYLMVSDVNPDDSLLAFTDNFIEKMLTYGIKLPLYACGSVNASAAFILLPEQDKNWKIYGVSLLRQANISKPYSYEQFQRAIPNMTLIWQGENVYEFLKQSSLVRNRLFFKFLSKKASEMNLKGISGVRDESPMSLSTPAQPHEDIGSKKHARDASADSEADSSPATKKPTPPISPTSPPMRPRSPLSFLEQDRGVAPSSSANLVSGSSLSPRKQALLDALLKEFEGEEEQLSAVVQKAIDNKKRIDREQPPLAVVR